MAGGSEGVLCSLKGKLGEGGERGVRGLQGVTQGAVQGKWEGGGGGGLRRGTDLMVDSMHICTMAEQL